MLSFLGLIFPFLSGIAPTISSIIGQIANEKIAAINATTDVERIHAQERVSALEARRDAMIAEATHPWTLNGLIRGLIALGPMVFLLKVFIYDKVLQSVTHGSTDALDPNLWWVVQTTLGFYFLAETGIGVARIFARR